MKAVTSQPMAGRNGRGWPRAVGLAVPLLAVLAFPAMVADGAAAARIAVSARGSLRAWEDDHNGQLGDGATTSSDTPVAVKLPAGATVTSVRAGGRYRLALTSVGQVLAWGDNEYGQLGDGTTKGRRIPVRGKLPAGTRVIAVGAGYNYSL